MSLAEFDHAEGKEGYRYELSRGVVTVMDVPKLRHGRQVDAVRRQFDADGIEKDAAKGAGGTR